jgi:hypothetical protein
MFRKLLILFSLIIFVNAKCKPFDGVTGIGYLTVCKSNGLKDCKTISSIRRTCINLVNGPHISGKSGDESYECLIWPEPSCSGKPEIIRSSGSDFPFVAKSYACPYQCE